MAWTPPDHWTEVQSQLKLSGQVTLDATGNGVLIFNPGSARERWVVRAAYVSTNQAATATLIPQAQLALNTVSASTMSQGNQRGSTWSGNQDTWSGEEDVSSGDFLSVLFFPPTGKSGAALAGVVCNVVVTGDKFTRRA
jgi:hypothetical protein